MLCSTGETCEPFKSVPVLTSEEYDIRQVKFYYRSSEHPRDLSYKSPVH